MLLNNNEKNDFGGLVPAALNKIDISYVHQLHE